MSSPLQNPAIQEKLVNFFLEKGGPIAGIGLCMASLCWVALGIIRKSWEGALLGFTFFWLAVSATSIFWRSKRNSQLVASVAAEQIIQDRRRPDNATAIPEVHKAIVEQIINGDAKVETPK
jgi:hypothetical protein